MQYDVIIIGAGASGLMCAISAGKRGRSVLMLEHAGKIGSKLRISGGGRCNFSNREVSADHYVSRNPHFCKSALAQFSPSDFVCMIEAHGIAYYEKEAGQLFCKESSRRVIAMLQEECDNVGAKVRYIYGIERVEKNDLFSIKTDKGEVSSHSLVIASGGLSYSSLGATDIGYRIARQFGIEATPLQPGLVPFTFNPHDRKLFQELSGISLFAEVRCNAQSFSGNILFTHKGISGPAVLQASLYWKGGDPLLIDLLPNLDGIEVLLRKRSTKAELHTVLSSYLPQRFSRKWCELIGGSRPLNQYTEKELRDIAQQLYNWMILPSGTEGYAKAEVTLGGVSTDELSSKTMESKKVSGLFFIGEVVDVTGQLGGYNLQWAWSSGYVAGQYA